VDKDNAKLNFEELDLSFKVETDASKPEHISA